MSRSAASIGCVALFAFASSLRSEVLLAQTPNPDYAAIDSWVAEQMAALHIPGLALGIVKGDKITHLKGFGVADSSGRLMTPQTPMIIGSLSKSFTALAIMQLVDAGRVDLDAPVRRYLPWFEVGDADASARITIRDLLNHTSGIPTMQSQLFLADDDVSSMALERRVRALRTTKLVHPVHEMYEYCGTNYATLGLIIQVVSGESYEDYIAQHIFVPLAMDRSFTDEVKAARQGLASGYLSVFGIPVATHLPFNRGSIAQGYLMSTAEDMSRYLVAQMNGGRFEGVAVVTPQRLDEMHRAAVETRQEETSYGMGWKIGPLGGVPAIWHDGSVFNFSANMALIPEGPWGIVMLKNFYNGPDEERLNQVMDGVVNLVVGRPPPAIPRSNHTLWIAYAIVVALLALQLVLLVRSIRRLRRWREKPGMRPRRWFSVVWFVALPSLMGFAWALTLVVLLPIPFGMPLLTIARRIPDFGYALVLSAALAALWAFVRAALYVRALRVVNASPIDRA